MVFRGKRGVELTLYDAIEVVMAIAVILVFYNHAVSAGRNTEWERRYLASDIALTIDAAQAVPGNLLYSYIPQSIRERGREAEESAIRGMAGSTLLGSLPFGTPAGFLLGYYWGTSWQPLGLVPIEISQYLIDVADGVVSVYDVKQVGDQQVRGSTATQRFIPSQLGIGASLTNPPFLAISKTEQEIQLTADLERLRVAQCPVVDTAGVLAQKIIVLDHGGEPGAREIAEMLHAICPNCRVLPQRQSQEQLTQLPQADLIVGLRMGEHGAGNDVLAFIPLDSPASSKLGCLLSNRVIFSPIFGNARIIPVDQASLAPDDPRQLLQRDTPSAIIQFGSKDMLPALDAAKKGEIARAIYDGLRLYYAGAMPLSQARETIAPTQPSETRPALAQPSCQGVSPVALRERLARNGMAAAGAMGDSITAGPPSFLDALQERCPRMRFENHGIRFNNAQQMATRFDADIIRQGYDDAIILGGVNDLGAGRATDRVAQPLQAMYDAARAAGIRVIAVTVLPWKGYPTWTEEKQRNTEALNQRITALPKDGQLIVVDAYALLGDEDDPARLQPAYQQDRLHLTDAGADALADAIYQAAYQNDPRCTAGAAGRETPEQACAALGGRWELPGGAR